MTPPFVVDKKNIAHYKFSVKHIFAIPDKNKTLPEADCCKNFFYNFELEGVRRNRKHKTKPRKPKVYVNPVTQALDYKRMMKEQNLTQIGLARKLGISRVRVTQYLNLLRLPKEQLDYIMQNGKEEKITERSLRDSQQNKSKQLLLGNISFTSPSQ